jgi:hypothetical protein
MLTARIMTDTPRRGLETSFDPKQGPRETTGGIMDMIFGRSPFAPGPMTRARSREYSGLFFPTIDPPLGQPEEDGGVYDPADSGTMFLPADICTVRERMSRPPWTGLKRSADVTLDVPPPREDEPEEPEVVRGVESPTLKTVVETVEEDTDDSISDPTEARETVMEEETVPEWAATGPATQTSEAIDTTDPEELPPAEDAGGMHPEPDGSDSYNFDDSDEERPQENDPQDEEEPPQEDDSSAPAVPAPAPQADDYDIHELLCRQRERREEAEVARPMAELAGGGGSGGSGRT